MVFRLAKTGRLAGRAASSWEVCRAPTPPAGAPRISAAQNDASQAVPSFEEICEQAQHALRVWKPTATAFLPPALTARVLARSRDWPEIGVLCWGGYEAAERQRMLLAPRQLLDLTPNIDKTGAQTRGGEPVPQPELAPWPEQHPVGAVRVLGNFLLQTLLPSDVIGALADLGIDPGACGDVVAVSERGANFFLLPSAMDDVVARLTHVGGQSVRVTALAPGDLPALRVPRRVAVTSVESSLRADAVLSAGLGCGRSQAATLIKTGAVQLDWRPLRKPATEVGLGATLTCAGRGRVVLVAVQPTAKGRLRLTLERIA